MVYTQHLSNDVIIYFKLVFQLSTILPYLGINIVDFDVACNSLCSLTF
jgi:hypothetical protein